MNRSGKKQTYTYKYYPEKIAADSTFLNYGVLQMGDTATKYITITNTGKSPVTITGCSRSSTARSSRLPT
jgi:hypothetical protein